MTSLKSFIEMKKDKNNNNDEIVNISTVDDHTKCAFSTIVNGKRYKTSSKSLIVNSNGIFADDRHIKAVNNNPYTKIFHVTIIVHGNAGTIKTTTGSVTILGSNAGVNTETGKVAIRGSVNGIVQTMNGEVNIEGNVQGQVATLSGNVHTTELNGDFKSINGSLFNSSLSRKRKAALTN